MQVWCKEARYIEIKFDLMFVYLLIFSWSLYTLNIGTPPLTECQVVSFDQFTFLSLIYDQLLHAVDVTAWMGVTEVLLLDLSVKRHISFAKIAIQSVESAALAPVKYESMILTK